MPKPAIQRTATNGWVAGSLRTFGVGLLIGLGPGVISLTIGLLSLPFWFSPLVPTLATFVLGIVMVFRERTRQFGAGLVLGSVLAGILVPVVAIVSWFADPIVVF